MKQDTAAHRQSNLIRGTFALIILLLMSIAPVYAANDIMVTRPHSASSTMSSKFYLGVNVGSAVYDEVDDSGAAFALFGGHHINEVLALEFAWVDVGEASKDTVKVEVSTLQAGLIGRVPISNNLALFGEVGLARWEFDMQSSGSSGSDDDIDVYFGFGGDYLINSRSTIRFKANFYTMKPTISNVDRPEEKITLISIGYIFKL